MKDDSVSMSASTEETAEQFGAITGTASDGAFATAFNLPADFPDDLRALHLEIITALRKEASGLPMNTVQTLLLERIAFFYVTMKRLEREERVSPARMRDMTKQWQDMTTEFNRQLHSSSMKLRAALINDVLQIINDATPIISDNGDRREFRTYIATKFEEIGE